MDGSTMIDRRTLLADLGKGAFALAVVSVAGCAPAALSSARSSASQSAAAGPTGDPASAPPSAAASASAPPSSGAAFAWERVNLGFVSAYILSRDDRAVIIDTGVEGSADAIEESLFAVGLDWSSVDHLILTHHHRDHAGSVADVLERAVGAMGYAGAEDVPFIPDPRPLTEVSDGDEVFGLTIVGTPGHTPGSISVLDPASGLLVAGDAIGTNGGKPTLPGAEFTEDMDLAKQSIVKLGGLTFETLLVGHGDPIENGASAAVAALGATG